ncbi:50S ribosomal protein L21 [candidate division KSB1 bacterium]|nr:50S ribosomal protein L21 [candidate division KSB1 bacterium]
MYAIVEIGGEQFKVSKNDKIVAAKLSGDIGSSVDIENVLLLSMDKGIKVGTPYIEGAKVQATIVEHNKADKVIVFKKKRRKRYRVLKGHRQPQTTLQIKEIKA